MALPKWLIPAGLTALIVGGLAYVRKPSPQVGDVVGVNAGRLLVGTTGNVAVLPVTIPPSAKVAIQLDRVEGKQLGGSVVGYIDPTSMSVVSLNAPVGIGPFGFDVSSVTDIFRGGKKL